MWDTRDSKCLHTLFANRPPSADTKGISNPKKKNKTMVGKKNVYFFILKRPTVPGDEFASRAPFLVQECRSSLIVCWSQGAFFYFLWRQLLIFEGLCVRGIEFKLNNATRLIVPNKITSLPAKTAFGICISGNPAWKRNKETI